MINMVDTYCSWPGVRLFDTAFATAAVLFSRLFSVFFSTALFVF